MVASIAARAVGRSSTERAEALVGLAHPEFRHSHPV
jgi:acyl-CoA hydrolase